jgi:hypothetical protein
MVWADTEICPYFGLGRYGVLPLLWVGRARLDTLAGHRECCAKVCPYIGMGRHGSIPLQGQGVLREGLPLHRDGQTRLDTLAGHRECCAKVFPYIGMGRNGSIPLQGTGSAAQRSAPIWGWAGMGVCPYELIKISPNCEIVMLTQISIIK